MLVSSLFLILTLRGQFYYSQFKSEKNRTSTWSNILPRVTQLGRGRASIPIKITSTVHGLPASPCCLSWCRVRKERKKHQLMTMPLTHKESERIPVALFLNTADWLCFLFNTVILIYFSFLYFFLKACWHFKSQKSKNCVTRKEKKKILFLPRVICKG